MNICLHDYWLVLRMQMTQANFCNKKKNVILVYSSDQNLSTWSKLQNLNFKNQCNFFFSEKLKKTLDFHKIYGPLYRVWLGPLPFIHVIDPGDVEVSIGILLALSPLSCIPNDLWLLLIFYQAIKNLKFSLFCLRFWF